MTGDPEKPEANTHHLWEPNEAVNGVQRTTEREGRQPEAETRKLRSCVWREECDALGQGAEWRVRPRRKAGQGSQVHSEWKTKRGPKSPQRGTCSCGCRPQRASREDGEQGPENRVHPVNRASLTESKVT